MYRNINLASKVSALCFFALVTSSANSLADTVLLQGQLNESMSAQVKVSGSLVRGVSLGLADTNAKISGLKFSIPDVSKSALPFCLKIATQDGVYSGNGNFTIPVGAAGLAGLAQKSKYENEVSKYNSSELAVIARIGSDCMINLQSPIIPTVYSSHKILVAQLQNRGSGLRVQLLGTSGAVLEGKCSSDSTKRKVAFDTVCAFNLSNFPMFGVATLKVIRRENSGVWAKPESFSILLGK